MICCFFFRTAFGFLQAIEARGSSTMFSGINVLWLSIGIKEELDTNFSVLLSPIFLLLELVTFFQNQVFASAKEFFPLWFSILLLFLLLLERVNCLAWEIFIFPDAFFLNYIHFLLQRENKLAFEKVCFGSSSIKKINIA